MINGTLSCKLSYTILAFVGLGFQLMFALGAATGIFEICKNSWATELDGRRIQTYSNGQVYSEIILGFFFNSSVKGHGINLSIIVC
jgi:hypothetical protein